MISEHFGLIIVQCNFQHLFFVLFPLYFSYFVSDKSCEDLSLDPSLLLPVALSVTWGLPFLALVMPLGSSSWPEVACTDVGACSCTLLSSRFLGSTSFPPLRKSFTFSGREALFLSSLLISPALLHGSFSHCLLRSLPCLPPCQAGKVNLGQSGTRERMFFPALAPGLLNLSGKGHQS